MSVSALRAGYIPSFDITSSVDPLATLTGMLATGAYSATVVGPLLSLQWADFVPRFPRTRFVLVDAPPPGTGAPPNAVFLTFDRTAAFRQAGRAAGKTLATGSASEAVAGILSSEASGLTPQESDAFARGVADVHSGALPIEQTLAASADPKDIRAAVAQMRSEGVTIFLLGLGERDPDGLEAVRDAGARAVVSDWQSSRALPSAVVASVEEDVTAGIRLALRALRAGTPRVAGPVSVVGGKKI